MMKSGKLILVIGLFIASKLFCGAIQTSRSQLDRGGEWLSWSPSERSTYVNGFIFGNLQGVQRACKATDKLFEVGKTHRLGQTPYARCLAELDEYSKIRYEGEFPDFSAYTNVITEFYKDHPEYRGIPFVGLMNSLSDRNYRNADGLYQMALKGELRPAR